MKGWILAASVAAVAVMAFAATASADVPRYQTQSGTLTVTLDAPYGYIHTYNITVNPCDNTFAGTGGSDFGGAAPASTESIAGTLVPGTLTFTATYNAPGYLPGYQWFYNGPTIGGPATDSTGLHFGITTSFNLTASTWKNHGQYVKEQGGGSDAAHSCVGMPMPAGTTYAWSTTGTVDSSSPTGTNVTLPIAGHYRIDVNGMWDNGVWYGVDAEYVQQTDLSWAQGWPGYPTVDFGDLQVNAQFVDWGAYSGSHAYTYAAAFPAGTLNLAVWDMWGDLITDGHSDNVGSLDYTITYVGP